VFIIILMAQGRFEIISLSGSFLLAQDGGTRSRTGGLSVALAGSDGRVLGGCVAGMLMASTPVQVYFFYIYFIFPYSKFIYFFIFSGIRVAITQSHLCIVKEKRIKST
jgi:Plants and Prokaryotes Conserved (PCC) domain